MNNQINNRNYGLVTMDRRTDTTNIFDFQLVNCNFLAH